MENVVDVQTTQENTEWLRIRERILYALAIPIGTTFSNTILSISPLINIGKYCHDCEDISKLSDEKIELFNKMPINDFSIFVGFVSNLICNQKFVDDFKKLVLKNTEGLNPKLKMLGLLIIATIYTVYLSKYLIIGTDILIPFTDYKITMPTLVYIPFTILVMLSATNAVNLTDGIDGLAATVLTIITLSLTVISIKCEEAGIATFSTIVAGSCAGFLIYNVYKAKVFMGDTGSLLLGGVISSIAIYIKNPLLLVIIAIVPILETLSVIMQVISFRFTGKRMFRMAPLHHHFELSGWRENKVVVVFGFITLIFCILGVLSI